MKFETSLGLDDRFPIGDLEGATVREAIDHNPEFVHVNHTIHFVLKGDAIKYMMKKLP